MRDRLLQDFSNQAWQRHQAHHLGHPGPVNQWPGGETFHTNWPLLALDLIVGDWKLAAAAAGTTVEWTWNGEEWVTETDIELLDPSPAPERDWRDVYAAELAKRPQIMQDLSTGKTGDGIELVLERAQLTSGERAVMRAWLYNPDLAAVAADLNWRPQTVGTLHRNALHRLNWLGQNSAVGTTRREHGNAFGRKQDSSRASSPPISGAVGSRNRDHAQPRTG